MSCGAAQRDVLVSYASFRLFIFNRFASSPFDNLVFLRHKVDNPLNQSKEEETMEHENHHVNSKDVAEVDPSQDQDDLKTTRVVKSIVELSTGVQMTRPEEFVDLVKVSCKLSTFFVAFPFPYQLLFRCLIFRRRNE